MCSKNSRGRGRSLVSMEFSDFFSLIAHAWDASSIYLTVQEVAFEFIIGVGFTKGLGIDGLSRAPLNFTLKKKQSFSNSTQKKSDTQFIVFFMWVVIQQLANWHLSRRQE